MARFGTVLTAMVTPFDDDLALDLDAAAAFVSSTLWRVSLLPVPAMTGTVTASATHRQRSAFSPSVSTGDSPVVPATTKPSLP